LKNLILYLLDAIFVNPIKRIERKIKYIRIKQYRRKRNKNYLSSNKKEKKREESNINELMNLRDELIGERTFISNKFYKIPVKAIYKQNERRYELEQRIVEIDNNKLKLE